MGLRGVAITPDGSTVYVANINSNNVSIINTTNNTAYANVPVGPSPLGIAITPNGATVYVATSNNGNNNVSVINTTNNTAYASVPVGIYADGVAVTPDGSTVYVVNGGNNNVSVINTTNNTAYNSVNVGNNPTAFGQFIPTLITPTITWTNPANITYGTSLSGTQLDATASVSGNFVYTPPLGTVLSAGQNQQLNTIFTPTDITNYTTASKTVFINVVPAVPALNITKIANLTSYDHVDQVIGYNYTIVNTGNVNLTAPFTVTDNLTTVGYTAPLELQQGQNFTGTATYTITQSDYDKGSVTNLANTAGFYNNTQYTATNTTTITATGQNPALNITKIASPTNYSAVGDLITYTYNVTNSGNVDILLPINITDNRTGNIQINNSKFAYITNSGSNTVSVIDTTTNSVTATVNANGLNNPFGVAVTSDGSTVYMANNGNHNVSVINTTNNTAYISVNVGNNPFGVAVTPDGSTVYVTVSGTGYNPGTTVSVINTTNNTAYASINVGNTPYGVAVTPDGATVYVANEGSNTVSVINTSTNTVTATVNGFDRPIGLSITPDGTNVYVSNYNSNSVSVISTTNNTAYTSVTVGYGPAGVAVTPDGSTIYVTNAASNTVSVINTTNNTAYASVNVGSEPQGVAVTQDGATVYVANYNSNTVSVINTTNNTAYANVNVGNGPIAFGQFIGSISPILAPGHSVIGTSTYTITQSDYDNGYVTNTAFATGFYNNNQYSATNTTTVTGSGEAAALNIIKIANLTSYDHVGQVIGYTYNVTNTGNVNLTAPFTVTDNLTTIGYTAPLELQPGQNFTGTSTYTITQSDYDNGYVTNTAFATGFYNNNQYSATNTTTVTGSGEAAALNIIKIANLTSYDHVGQVIGYTYNVTNTGNVNLTAPFTVTDNLTTIGYTAPLELQPGQNFTGTSTYTITQSDYDNGYVTNTAFATGFYNNNQYSATNTTTVTGSGEAAALNIIKIANLTSYDHVGQVIGYTYNVTNTGNVNLTAPFTVTDNLTTIGYTAPLELQPGQNFTGTSTYTITQSDYDNGSVTNLANATGFYNNNQYSATNTTTVTAINQNKALTITKVPNSLTYTDGQTVTYTYTVQNIGNVTLKDVNVNDNLVGPITLLTHNLAPGNQTTGTAIYTTTQSDYDSGSVTNTATVYNGTTQLNQTTATVTAAKGPALGITKVANLTNYSTVGQVIEYTYNVSNTGIVDLTGNITVKDNRTGTFNITSSGLPVGGSVTGTANYTITQTDIDAGSVTNLANATGSYNGEPVISPDASVKVTGSQCVCPPICCPNSESCCCSPCCNVVDQNVRNMYNINNAGDLQIKTNINS